MTPAIAKQMIPPILDNNFPVRTFLSFIRTPPLFLRLLSHCRRLYYILFTHLPDDLQLLSVTFHILGTLMFLEHTCFTENFPEMNRHHHQACDKENISRPNQVWGSGIKNRPVNIARDKGIDIIILMDLKKSQRTACDIHHQNPKNISGFRMGIFLKINRGFHQNVIRLLCFSVLSE